jgi:hypothetical protein
MLTISGEVRKVIDNSYTDKRSGKPVQQALVIIEPLTGRQNYEVFLNQKQIKTGVLEMWERLRGAQVRVPVALFVSHEHRFYKFNAEGSGEPEALS